MFGSFIGGLLTAWILSLFSINDMLIEVVQPMINRVKLTDSHYYIFFGLLGIIKETMSAIINYFLAKY